MLLTLASSVLGGATLLPGADGVTAAGAAAACRRVAAVPRRFLVATGAEAVTTAADCSDVAGGVTMGVAAGLGAAVDAAGAGVAATVATGVEAVVEADFGVVTVGSGVELPGDAGCVLIGGTGDVDAV